MGYAVPGRLPQTQVIFSSKSEEAAPSVTFPAPHSVSHTSADQGSSVGSSQLPTAASALGGLHVGSSQLPTAASAHDFLHVGKSQLTIAASAHCGLRVGSSQLPATASAHGVGVHDGCVVHQPWQHQTYLKLVSDRNKG